MVGLWFQVHVMQRWSINVLELSMVVFLRDHTLQGKFYKTFHLASCSFQQGHRSVTDIPTAVLTSSLLTIRLISMVGKM